MSSADDAKWVEGMRVQLRSLRAQLDVLEARLQGDDAPSRHSFADLAGILKGQADTSPEEVDKALFRSPRSPSG